MKFKSLILCLIFTSINLFAQHTEKFLNLSKQIKFIDSVKIETKFGNGKLKEVKTIIKYEYDGYHFEFKTGLNSFYFKDGRRYREVKYDLFGNILNDKSFNINGNLYVETNTIEIDTDTKSVIDFLRWKMKTKITSYEKEYTNNSYDNLWLYKEGMRVNGNKTGIWKEYCKDSLKKETNFK